MNFNNRKKISKNKKGKRFSIATEFKKGQISWIKGKYHSKETKEKMKQNHKGMKDKKHSKETRIKISKTKQKNPIRYWLGKYHTEKTKQKIGKANKGEKSGNWQGGISFEPYSVDWVETLRRSIRERDNYICQFCSQYGNIVHHIDYNKKNCCPENLITLCRSCNSRVNFNRDYWQKYFYDRMSY